MTAKLETRSLNLWYGDFQALRTVNLTIRPHAITSIIGPSGCGKSTLLRVFNRMNDTIPQVRVSGDVLLDGDSILGGDVDLRRLRKRVGMVFQRPNPFPLSVFGNVAYGPKIHRLSRNDDLIERVEKALRQTGLWEALKDRLDASALSLTPEQQQRVCISRLLAVEPEVLLMDEPCSALDPIATARIEELMFSLKQRYTIVIVTHNMQQAARVSDDTAFMLLGDLVEVGKTQAVFTRPSDKKTEQYISGRFG
ncbi:MAG TPA: phosphate ABC transporter ATP-binding protein PstB [Acidobacteriota bacterium]|nr:phosphate ABC transporter ATP-binding protein PstB [Acidobacteriota bacterium]